jgi:hypothetical protein
MSARAELLSMTRPERFSRIDDYTTLPKLGANSVVRDGAITVRKEKTNDGYEIFSVQLDGPAFGLAEGDKPMLEGLNLSPTRLQEHVDVCRAVWREVIATSSERRSRLFRRRRTEQPWTARVQQDEDVLRKAGARLACAGADLLKVTFSKGTNGLPALRERLRSALAGADRVITVYADEFFLPWPMLYLHPVGAGELAADGGNWRAEGFLGYRHVIEQATDNFVPTAAIPADSSGLAFGFTFDPAIDAEQGVSCIVAQQKFFAEQSALRREERSSKRDVEKAFREPLRDQISYFFLHSRTAAEEGRIVPGRFFLGQDHIEAAEIRSWCETLPSEPLFFFNACQAGQMRTLFYESFALLLLELRARGLIGPQVDIPTLFAQEYARRFFAALLAKDVSPPPRVGSIVRGLARDFIDKDRNPLGLAYSLYKGLDCYLAWPGRAPGPAKPSRGEAPAA